MQPVVNIDIDFIDKCFGGGICHHSISVFLFRDTFLSIHILHQKFIIGATIIQLDKIYPLAALLAHQHQRFIQLFFLFYWLVLRNDYILCLDLPDALFQVIHE
jgi:hypothetical protein